MELRIFIATLSVGLAAFSTTYMMRHLEGPGDVFARVRRRIGLDLPVYNDAYQVVGYMEDTHPTTFITKLYACFWCLTTWICLAYSIVYIAVTALPLYYLLIIWPGAVSAAGLLYEEIQNHHG